MIVIISLMIHISNFERREFPKKFSSNDLYNLSSPFSFFFELTNRIYNELFLKNKNDYILRKKHECKNVQS